MKGKINITDKEWNHLLEAVDFIYSNSDGADDPKPFISMAKSLRCIFEKAKKEHFKIINKINTQSK